MSANTDTVAVSVYIHKRYLLTIFKIFSICLYKFYYFFLEVPLFYVLQAYPIHQINEGPGNNSIASQK